MNKYFSRFMFFPNYTHFGQIRICFANTSLLIRLIPGLGAVGGNNRLNSRGVGFLYALSSPARLRSAAFLVAVDVRRFGGKSTQAAAEPRRRKPTGFTEVLCGNWMDLERHPRLFLGESLEGRFSGIRGLASGGAEQGIFFRACSAT